MFLDATLRRNPALVDIAVELHRVGEIGPNTFVLDVDAVSENARLISSRAAELGLRLHVMTKQQGRNPFMAMAALAGGIPTAVAVDVPEARLLRLHDVPLGHVGHLVQVPARDSDEVIGMEPGVVTVFSVQAARRLDEAARRAGRTQGLLMRVWKPGDSIYPGQEGGFRLGEVAGAARDILRLRNVRIAGVTSFPCLMWDEEAREVRETGNLATVEAAAEILRGELDLPLSEINAPGVTAAGTLALIKRRGATHGEPGSSLTAHTPLHAAGDQPEIPGMVYVSEVASVSRERACCFGGGFYARSRLSKALLIDRNGGRRMVSALRPPAEWIDYYGSLETGRARPNVGDTVVFAFRSQVFVGRCQVAAVAGVSDRRPRLLGTCDQHGNVLGPDQLPLNPDQARQQVRERWVTQSGTPNPTV